MEEQNKKAQANDGSRASSKTSTTFSRWIAEQIAMLEIALDIKLTPERKQLYVSDLERSGVTREQLGIAFQKARLLTTDYFPKMGELVRLSGAVATNSEQAASVEALEAWETAQKYLQKWGVDRTPVYVRGAQPFKGHYVSAPALEPRIEYALRRIGGLAGLNQITEEKRPFMLRDFLKGFEEAPVADVMGLLPAPQEQRLQLPEEAHEGEPVDMGDLKAQLLKAAHTMPEAPAARPRVVSIREVPPAIQLTKEQIEARREMERAECERVRRQMEEERGA